MKLSCIVLSLCTTVLSFSVSRAQMIDNTLAFKNINEDRYFRFDYENDFFSATDIYYTQGFIFEYAAPWVRKFPISKILWHPVQGQQQYSLALEHNGFTPTSLGSDTILHGDRPFCASVMIKTSQTTIDNQHHQRFSTSFAIGAIGPAAIGAEMQTYIHQKLLSDAPPHGWGNQIHNDIILNYRLNYEKEIWSYGKLASLSANGELNAGTLTDNTNAGISLIVGYLDNPFQIIEANGKHFRIYAYDHPQVNIIGYDATLEGGILNHTSPYVINTSNIVRVVFQNRVGFVASYKGIYLEYFQTFLSAEFKTGLSHKWGGIQIAFAL